MADDDWVMGSLADQGNYGNQWVEDKPPLPVPPPTPVVPVQQFTPEPEVNPFNVSNEQSVAPAVEQRFDRFWQPRPRAENSPTVATTASPLVSITEDDVQRAIDKSMNFSGGGAKIKGVEPKTMPEVAERYPVTVEPVWKADPKKAGKLYEAKGTSAEAKAVSTLRAAAQKEIDKGNYEPYFPPAERFDVDPKGYPAVEPTSGKVAQRPGPENAKAYAEAASPEARARLDAAFDRGMQQKQGAENWYMMGQLEREYIKEYGLEEGRRQFKAKFADAMAATTGGASPKDNLMMAHYGNYLKTKGEPLPERAFDYPFPVGGRYAASNMEQYKKMLMEGSGLTPANPKRYNFSANYLGNRAGSTIDEQMMGLANPGGQLSPPKGAYGNYEGPVNAAAAARGFDPRYYQEVAWAGAKDAKDAAKGGFKAQPMIDIVNEAIERTHRITGMPKAEIVRRGLVRSEIPLYGLAGATTMGGIAAQDRYRGNNDGT